MTLAQKSLVLLWLIAVAGAGFALLIPSGVALAVGPSSLAFIVVLIGTLSRKRPHAADLPDTDFLLTPPVSLRVATLIVTTGIAFLLGMAQALGLGASAMLAAALIGLALTIAWRTKFSARLAALGLIAGISAGLGVAFLGDGNTSWAIFNAVTVPPSFTGGSLLMQRTQLARMRFLNGEYALSLQSLLRGCVLAAPAALLNLLGNIQQHDIWVVNWWQPLYALVPAIAEETWARLMLTTACYALLRPASNDRPRFAVLAAILIGAFIHGLAHSGMHPTSLLIGSVLYGVPTALLYIKQDFEHAVGYHFFIDFVRYTAALIEA